MKFNKLQQEAIDSCEPKLVITAAPGSGKLLLNSTGVLTENGYVPIGSLRVGDKVYGRKGVLCTVTGVHPQNNIQIYNVHFNDRNIIKCCGEHLWCYQTTGMHRRGSKTWRVQTTESLYKNVPCHIPDSGYQRKNIYLPMIEPIQFPIHEKTLSIPPYTMGALLGDGGFSGSIGFTNKDLDIVERVNSELANVGSTLKHNSKYDYRIGPTKNMSGTISSLGLELENLGLIGKKSEAKFIPKQYLYASIENRLDLLAGLIDTDGYVAGSSYEYYSVSKQLADDVEFLCETLGFLVTRTIKPSSYKDTNGNKIVCKDCHRLFIKASAKYPKLHWCARKDKMWRKAQSYAHRNIVKIEPTDEYADMTCISVDSSDHLYVIDHCILTHNTSCLVGAIKKYIASNPGKRVAAITFTRKAADDLARKIYNPNVVASTIHSWSLRELNRLGVKHNFKVEMLSDKEMQDILLELSRGAGYYTLNQFLLFLFITGNYNLDITDSVRNRFMRISGLYEKYKREKGLYDFMDLPLYLLNMLEKYNEQITHFEALFVDEFQDVDDIQNQVFKKVVAEKKFYIGDRDQAIYRFRGATPEVLEELREEDFFYSTLVDNYRSYQEILDFSTSMYSLQPANLLDRVEVEDSWIRAIRGPGGTVKQISEKEVYNCITGETSRNLNTELDKVLTKKPQILCRGNKEVKLIKETGYERVSTIHLAKGLEFDDVIVVDFEAGRGEEELSIAYVACTRAKNSLTIVHFNVLIDILYYGNYKTEAKKLF